MAKLNAVDFFMGPRGPWKNPNPPRDFLDILLCCLGWHVNMKREFESHKGSMRGQVDSEIREK